MKNYGDVNIIETGEIINADIESGIADPTPALVGRIFFRTDLNAMRVYNGTSWASFLTNSSGTAVTATNIAGGIASEIPYQTAAGTTAFIANGTSGQILTSNGTSAPSWTTVGAGTGTVTSVALADGSSTPIYNISGSPVTTSGTLTFSLAQQTVNKVFAGPATGSSGQPTFRSLVVADLPSLTSVAVTSAVAGTGISVSGATGAVTISNTGVTSITGTANQIAASSSTGAVTLSFPNNVIIPAPSSGSALTINCLDATAGLIINDTTSTSGVRITFSDSVTIRGLVGNGPETFTGGSINDFGITANGGRTILGYAGGTIALAVSNTGNVTINAPSSGVALTTTGVSGSFAQLIQGFNSAGGTSYGLEINAGNTTDYAIEVNNYNNSAGLFSVQGNGAFALGKGGTGFISGNSTGNISITTPSSGTALTINTPDDAVAMLFNVASAVTGYYIGLQEVGVLKAGIGLGGVLGFTGSVVGDFGIYTTGATRIGGAGGTAQLTITSAGNVTIAAPSSGSALTINGDVVCTGTLNAVVLNATSDRNKKKDIVKIDNGLEIVQSLNGVRFNWIKDDAPSAGLIAQDVEVMMPELVTTTESGKILNYNGVIGALVESVKEMSAMIAELKAEVASLKAK